MVGRNLVGLISGLICEHEDVVEERGGSGKWRVDEVQFTPEVMGGATFTYDVDESGKKRAATRDDPAEYPELEIVNVKVVELEGWNEDGSEEVVPSPDEEKVWREAALKHFDERSYEAVLEYEVSRGS